VNRAGINPFAARVCCTKSNDCIMHKFIIMEKMTNGIEREHINKWLSMRVNGVKEQSGVEGRVVH
jgi:hypothetical protein